MSRKAAKQGLALNRLRVFAAVAETGSMTEAAEALKLTQPAVSRAMHALEASFGCRLVARSRRGCEATAEGAIASLRVQEFLRQVATALADAAQPGGRDASGGDLVRRLTTAQFEAVLAIAKARNLRAAAARLGKSDSSVHRAARELERLLKTALYRRTPEGLSLSPAGSQLARRLKLAANEVAIARDECRQARGLRVPMGVVVGAPPLAPKRILARACEELARLEPDSRVLVRESVYDELIHALRNGDIDVIFGALRRPPPFEDLQEEPLFTEPYVVVCRRGHPLSAAPAPEFSALGAFDWIYPAQAMPRRKVLENAVRDLGSEGRANIETSALDMTVALLAGSDRISLLPSNCANDRGDLLAVIDVPISQPQRWIGVTTRKNWLPTRAQSVLLRALRQG